MTDTQLLVGSLSNDLFRVANLIQRQAFTGSSRFMQEAKRWAVALKDSSTPTYIGNIAQEIVAADDNPVSLGDAEKYLMYGVILQNYALHNRKVI